MSQINRENERNNGGTSPSSERTDVWKPLGACTSLLRSGKLTVAGTRRAWSACVLRQRGTEAGRDPAERRQKHCIGLGGHQGEIQQPRQGWIGKQGTFSGIVSDSSFDKSPVAYSH